MCSAAQQPLPSLPTWAIPDVCSAATGKAAIGDIDNIDIQNRLLSMLNGDLEVLVGGRPIVLLHAGLWGLLLLTTLTACVAHSAEIPRWPHSKDGHRSDADVLAAGIIDPVRCRNRWVLFALHALQDPFYR